MPDSRHAKSYTTRQIAEHVAGRLEGPDDLTITGVEQIDNADTGQITFIGTTRYGKMWPASRATAALVQERLDLGPDPDRAFIRVPDTDLALAVVLEMFSPPQVTPPPGVHDRAFVDPTAELAAGAAVGALSHVGSCVHIGEDTVIHPSVTILDGAAVGAGCTLWPGVVIRERCVVGDGCILHCNVTIGADGFGYRSHPDGRSLVKIPQIGTVRLGRNVEIGAATCVDRGKFSETLIGDGTKIDNICQIGHNCRIGRCTIIAGLVGIGGSTTIGDGVMIGGGAIIKDHVTIGDGARLGGDSSLMNDIPPGETWHGHPAHEARAAFREFAAIRRLPELMRMLKQKRPDQQRAGAD
ncbi:MAG: UDP-3-O-(3-hydroxymyristoyl)glucosamine N-acyltransferase [Planctomycetota bacterium]|jgi:UDP-3-O-[3-hydroxymyristoyl] glucosamine N-acyltransferase